MENKKILKYLSCSCFTLFAILQSKALISALITIHRADFWIILFALGTILIAVSTWISQPTIMTIGAAFCALYYARLLLYGAFSDSIFGLSFEYTLNHILNIVFFSLLVVVCNLHDSKGIRTMGIAAGLFSIVKYIVNIILGYVANHAFSFNLIGIVINLSLIVGPLFLGYVFIGTKDKTVLKNTSESGRTPAKEDDTIARLVKLNSLLDAGIITQEEFEQKKKDILA